MSLSSISPPQYKTITLGRGPDGLGFSIVGGFGSPHGDLPIYVKTVFGKVRHKRLHFIFAELTNRVLLIKNVTYNVCVCALRGQQQRTAVWREETRSWPLTGSLWRASRTKKPLASWKGPKGPSHSLCYLRQTYANTHKHTTTHHLQYFSYTLSYTHS